MFDVCCLGLGQTILYYMIFHIANMEKMLYGMVGILAILPVWFETTENTEPIQLHQDVSYTTSIVTVYST